ncbi:2-amino-4-hydroxy-6-hydroxymethyldihydropteridinediphosphokinase [soil metagenome]
MFEKKIRMNDVVISLGSNMGNRLTHLETAIQQLKELPCILIKKSDVYETAAWGNTDQPSFYNQVIEIETELEPVSLMENILMIEKKMGRIRNRKWEPRIIDIDILFYNDANIQSAILHVPHPHLHERRFVLQPLFEILPSKIHPVLKKTISEMLNELKDTDKVEKLIRIRE